MEEIVPTLQMITSKGKGNYAQILKYSYEISKILYDLYNKNIIHRNISLSNIYISKDDNIQLTGLNYSIIVNDDKTTSNLNIIGNLETRGPEFFAHLKGRKTKTLNYNKQPSWELGIILFEICEKGKHPFPNYPKSVNNKLKLTVDYPSEYLDLIQKLIILDPSTRTTITEAYNTLNLLYSTINQ